MNAELTAKLIERGGDFIPSNFHFEVCSGWFEILDCFFVYARHHLSRWREVKEIEHKLKASGEYNEKSHGWTAEYFTQNPNDPLLTTQVCQIKEKFGGLRIYYNGQDPYIDGLISMAEAWAYRTCEECGKPGKRINMAVLCDEHDKLITT